MWSSYFCNGTVRVQSWKLWQTINLLTAINFWWFMVNHKSALSMTLILGLDFPPPSILQSICKHSFSTDSNWWWVQIQFNPFFCTHTWACISFLWMVYFLIWKPIFLKRFAFLEQTLFALPLLFWIGVVHKLRGPIFDLKAFIFEGICLPGTNLTDGLKVS